MLGVGDEEAGGVELVAGLGAENAGSADLTGGDFAVSGAVGGVETAGKTTDYFEVRPEGCGVDDGLRLLVCFSYCFRDKGCLSFDEVMKELYYLQLRHWWKEASHIARACSH